MQGKSIKKYKEKNPLNVYLELWHLPYVLVRSFAWAKWKVNKSFVLIFHCGLKTICGIINNAGLTFPCFFPIKEQEMLHCFGFWSQYSADLWEKHPVSKLWAKSLWAVGQNRSNMWSNKTNLEDMAMLIVSVAMSHLFESLNIFDNWQWELK